jgi:hypothetical protein
VSPRHAGEQKRPSSSLKLARRFVNWGNLLIATGRALKPIKCSYYLILFWWKSDGTWVYADNVGNDDFTIGVLLADGSLAEIEQLPVMTAVKTLGDR